jgi:hypothetical protein
MIETKNPDTSRPASISTEERNHHLIAPTEKYPAAFDHRSDEQDVFTVQ